MLLVVNGVLKPDELALARSWLADAPFVDGKLSAGAAARRVKQNQELDRGAGNLERLDRLVMGGLTRHPMYRNGALPLHAASPLYARYRPGMTYGDHLDDPIMGTDGVMYRSDVAVTVFLNAPEEYDGGELVIRTSAGEQAVKLPAGDAVLHVQSLVRDAARRELLYGLNAAREKLLQSAPEAEETAQVNAAYLDLIRMWSDI